MGTFTGEEFIAIGNSVVDCNINNGAYGTAGILGAYYSNHYAKTDGELVYDSKNVSKVKIYIEDCKVEGGKIEASPSGSSASGILSNVVLDMSYREDRNKDEYGKKVDITINKCQVGSIDEHNNDEEINLDDKTSEEEQNDKKKETIIQGGQYGTQGIVGQIIDNTEKNECVVNITNNIVSNVKIDNQQANWNLSNVCGILGYIRACQKLNIHNCKVLDSEISGRQGNISGIVGDDDSVSVIEGCEVRNVTINAGGECNTAGIISHNMSGYDNSLDIKDCNVIDLNIEYEKIETKSGVSSGGIVGYNSMKTNIDNCKVEGINIKGSCNSIGGFVGHDCNDTLKITNSKLVGHKQEGNENKKSKISGTEVIGGIVGYVGSNYTNNDATIIDNVECEDLEIEMDTCKDKVRTGGTNVGGVVGVGTNKMDITNIKVSNLDVDVKRSCEKRYPTPGAYGAIGGNMKTDLIMQNVKVDNVNMKSNEGNVAMAIANVEGATYYGQTGKLDVSNLEISNCKLETDIQESNVGSSYYYASCGVFGKVQTNESNLKDIKVDGLTINVNDIGDNVAGLVAFSINKLNVEDLEMNNCKITSKSNRDCAIGGVVGNVQSDVNMNEIKIEQMDIDKEGTNGGTTTATKGIRIGGIIGVDGPQYGTQSQAEINNVELKDININNKCDDAIVSAGIAVTTRNDDSSKAENVKISNVDAEDITINGKNTVGGLLGCGLAMIDNCKVTNPKITAETVNGVAGGIVGIAVEGTQLNNVSVTADESNVDSSASAASAEVKENEVQEGPSENSGDQSNSGSNTDENDGKDSSGTQSNIPEKYGVYSDNLAGGIAGVDSGVLLKGEVENIVVKTAMKPMSEEELKKYREMTSKAEGSEGQEDGANSLLTETSGDGNSTSTGESETASGEEENGELDLTKVSIGPSADAVQARALSNYFNTIIKNVKVIIGNKETVITMKDNGAISTDGN